MRAPSLRVRLTVLVTVIFAAALSAVALLGVNRMERTLRDDTRNNAEALLINYIEDLQGGTLAPGDPTPAQATRFVYLDDQGRDLPASAYQQLLIEALDAEITNLPDLPGLPDSIPPTVINDPPIIVDSGLSELSITVAADQEPMELDRGADVIAVGYPITVGDTGVTVAVSMPLQSIANSVDAVSQLLLVLVPTLTAMIAAAAWFVVGRSLRPVKAMSAQVDLISSESLDQRVSRPDTDDELDHLAATMNRMLDRLQTARDNQRQFISDASHELRSPITATRFALDVAQRQPDTTDWRATSDLLSTENTRLAGLVDDLLLLARLDETQSDAALQDVDLDEICLSEAQRPHPCAVDVHVDVPVRVRGNLANLTRCIRNLVDNATRHATTRVDITITQQDGAAVVRIVDDGPGIPEGDLERIFERFSRLDTSRNRSTGGGAGLGLAIAKHIALAHNGTVTATNRPTGGAQVTLTLLLDHSNQLV